MTVGFRHGSLTTYAGLTIFSIIANSIKAGAVGLSGAPRGNSTHYKSEKEPHKPQRYLLIPIVLCQNLSFRLRPCSNPNSEYLRSSLNTIQLHGLDYLLKAFDPIYLLGLVDLPKLAEYPADCKLHGSSRVGGECISLENFEILYRRAQQRQESGCSQAKLFFRIVAEGLGEC